MNIITGIDVVQDERITSLPRETLELYMLPAELALHNPVTIFAIKEAVAKALGITPPPWQEIEVHYKASKPTVTIACEYSAHITSYDISVSHEAGCTTAIFVAITTE